MHINWGCLNKGPGPADSISTSVIQKLHMCLAALMAHWTVPYISLMTQTASQVPPQGLQFCTSEGPGESYFQHIPSRCFSISTPRAEWEILLTGHCWNFLVNILKVGSNYLQNTPLGYKRKDLILQFFLYLFIHLYIQTHTIRCQTFKNSVQQLVI